MNVVVLGAGVTGLAVAAASGAPVYEAAGGPGGICASYYVRPGERDRLTEAPADGEAYRFEIGGGHWIFGGAPSVLRYVERLAPLTRYRRRSSVYFPDEALFVPYPLQYHLRFLAPDLAARALAEMAAPARPVRTMKEWLLQSFGPTLCAHFFSSFHELYTAGLYDRIAPQDAYKSPVDLATAIRGARADAAPAGYNVEFAYPDDGLGALARRIADGARVVYGRRAARIDVGAKRVHFADGGAVPYDVLLSSLPLNRAIDLAALDVGVEPDPFTSVLVLNVGARRGPACPEDHWLYVPRSRAGFHRVGFYDNVDVRFLPASARGRHDRASLYVERAVVGGTRLTEAETAAHAAAVVAELQRWGFIEDVEVVDPTWIDVAYTWSWPGSRWVALATRALEAHDVLSIGRYGRWVFQGLAESLQEGFSAGATVGG